MKNDAHALCLAAALALSPAACGDEGLSGTTDQPGTIVTIHGQIDNAAQLPLEAGSFRVAIVWGVAAGNGADFSFLRTAEDVAVTPAFPAQFQLALTKLPAPETMATSPDGKVKIASGSLVAYEDTNHNGKLDLIDPKATTSPDRVLSVPRDHTIIYIEGDLSSLPDAGDDHGAAPATGFQFLKAEPLGRWACTGGPVIAGVMPAPCPGFLWEPITAPLTLSVSTSPELSSYICGKIDGDAGLSSAPVTLTDGSLGDFGGDLPDKNDPRLICQPDGSVFAYGGCTPLPGDSLCYPKAECSLKTYTYDPSVADQWPCPRS